MEMIKFNGGIGAIICDKCSKIIKTDLTKEETCDLKPQYCKECDMVNVVKYKCKDESHNEFQDNGTSSTLLGWFPRFDRYGNLLNEDPNRHTTRYSCLECNKDYTKVKKGSVVKFYDKEGKEL